MVQGKIFTGFAEFRGIVSVNDFRLPVGLQELLQAPLCFLWSFCFARIRLDPLSGQVLHHDCISMIVSRFTIFTEDFLICCYQVTKIFSSRYGSAIASSARGSCDFGPLTDLAILFFFGNEYKHCAYPNPHVSLRSALKRLHEMNWRESLRVQEHHPPEFPWILAATPGGQNTTGCPVLSWVPFNGFLDFDWLGPQRVAPFYRQH